MLSKTDRRLYQHLLDGIRRENPDYLRYHRVWTDLPTEREDVETACRALNLVDWLPFPFQPCLLIGPRGWGLDLEDNSWERTGGIQCLFYSHSRSTSEYLTIPPGTSTIKLSFIYFCERFDIVGGKVEHWAFRLVRATWPSRADLLDYANYYGVPFIGDDGEKWKNVLPQYNKARIPETGSSVWMTMEPKPHKPGHCSAGLAGDTLDSLAGAIFPCGYKVKATPTGQATQAGPETVPSLTCQVSYDRLYRFCQEAGVCPAEVKPHQRRGHDRWLWYQRGIDRNSLPPEPHRRLALALQRRVPRRYIHPTWVGKRQFQHDGFRWDIQGGDTCRWI